MKIFGIYKYVYDSNQAINVTEPYWEISNTTGFLCNLTNITYGVVPQDFQELFYPKILDEGFYHVSARYEYGNGFFIYHDNEIKTNVVVDVVNGSRYELKVYYIEKDVTNIYTNMFVNFIPN